ncbi:hypothetical protein BV898_18170 [Hypsibius exemplaris]|uniref:Uncharacterized protein n=1 Tax=Hypsibius exemplaris TaxID=2072580 RepID=A0A9X6RMV8_HYPEX|nr:hypothetical protein BV898_18170 [Hypsibius exemplaris]
MATLSDTLLGPTGSVTRATDQLTLLESSARRKFTNISDEEALMDVFKMVTPDERDAIVRRNRGGFLVTAQGPLWKLPGEDVGETSQLSNISEEENHAVAVDCVNHHLYWTIWGKGIRRSWYDGSDNHLVVTKAGISLGLAVDFIARNMFWIQHSAILVAKMSHLKAGHKNIISHTEIDWRSALAVHPSRGDIVNSITKNGSTMMQHSLPAERSGDLWGLLFVPEQCPKLYFSNSLKCIEYYLMADTSSIAKLDEFGLSLGCTPAFSLTGIPTTVSDRRRDGHSLQKTHAQTVAERNTMTASPEDLAEYDIEEETSAAPEIAESVR